MKLVPKLSLAFLTGVSIVLASNGYFRVRREIALFEADRTRDDVLIAGALSSAVETVWRRDGADAALAMLGQADAREPRVGVRWVWLDGSSTLAGDPSTLRARAVGEPFTWRGSLEGGDERRFTALRVAVPDPRPGAIEVSESLAPERAYVRRTIESTAMTALALDAVCALLATVLGAWIVGRPIAALAAKARQIGEGDFGTPLHLPQKDELAGLAGEMNAMCERLVEANERAARELRTRLAMMEHLRHADRLMTVGKLASGVAHEIGTPLNVVEARATIIVDGTSPSESVDCARAILRATERIARIIRQLLAFARRDVARKERRDLAVVVRHATELLEALAAKRRVELRVDDGGVPHPVDADGGQVEQVVTNLVMNALQATEGPGVVEIALDGLRALPPPDHGGPESSYQRVRVRDRGPGIPVENLPHVFEPFFTTKDVGEGTGLGLSIAYGIVREHGGWITAENGADRGAIFTFYLPTSEPV